jgi:error-prone DNA polymerase
VPVYLSAWLRKYHPAAFYTALLNNQPMGFWQPSVIIYDAKRRGIRILRVDVNLSHARCTLEKEVVRVGLNYIKGMGSTQITRLLAAREEHPFTSLTDFCRRTRFPVRLIENIIASGAMDGWKIPRRKLLWKLGTLQYLTDDLNLETPAMDAHLPVLTPVESLSMEYTSMGLSTEQHIMSLYRDWLKKRSFFSSTDLMCCSAGNTVQVAGLVVVRQAPPTAHGFQFITLEDEGGFINVIVRPAIYQQYRLIIRSTTLLMVQGEVQRESTVVNVVAQIFRPLPNINPVG